MSAIGVNHKGFNQLLSTRFYTQIVRTQLEYGLAISSFSSPQIKRIFGGNSCSLTKVMLHLTDLPSMKERVHRLQGKFLLRSINGSRDTLLSRFLPYLRASASLSHWYKLSKTPLWQRCCNFNNPDRIDTRVFNTTYHELRVENLQTQRQANNSVLLSCRPFHGVDPFLWLPMTPVERSRVIRWRLSLLPGGVPKSGIYHPNVMFTRKHSIICLHMHRRLQMPFTHPSPLIFDLTRAIQSHNDYVLMWV
ncbi:hypothetical protein BDF20DRAFT_841396 [Mycotypha africana]|uniref:uncharacterized protein n=1 Tax=Mycotypha africana TaxID=64632 RepID=UPI0023014540|nr:uncharacterized protein BDF20DRAFT_841396 [Mycotypha africana]KAI8990897.1 hypothetical protein BDF20DRAFT_841396 [Mycotypha africana]